MHRIEGDSLLCKGITLVAHFMELRILTKLSNLSRKFGFVKNNTTNDCFDAGLHFWWRNLKFVPTLLGGHEKICGSIQKILP